MTASECDMNFMSVGGFSVFGDSWQGLELACMPKGLHLLKTFLGEV